MEERRTVLLVEDELITAGKTVRLLEHAGYTVVHAPDGNAALEHLCQSVPDLVLMDIDLGPGMDGTETARRILEQADIPVVFLSSHTEPEIVEKTEAITSYGYVVKDAGRTVLLASMRMAFRLHAAKARLEKAEAERQVHETRYRELFENSFSGMAVYRPVDDGTDFEFVEFNRAGEEMDRQSRYDLIGRRLSEVRPQASSFGLLDALCRVSQTGTPEQLPFREYSDGRLQGVYRNSIYRLPGGEVVAAFENVTEQVVTQQELKESRERLQLVLEGSRLGFWDWEVQTGAVVFNDRWAEIVGYTLEEISPLSIQTWMDLAHPDDLAESDRLLQSHFNGETEYYEFETRMRHRDGHWVWVLDRGKVTAWDPQGKPLRMSGTHQDISLRKEAELALRERIKEKTCLAEIARVVRLEQLPLKEKLERIAALMPAGWQFPDTAAVSIRWEQFYIEHGEFSKAVKKQFSPLMLKNRVVGRLEVGYCREGVDFLPEEDALLHGIADLIGTAVQQQLTAEELRLSEELNRSIVRDIAEAVIVCKPDGTVQTWNNAAERIFGYSALQMKGQSLRMLVPEAEREAQGAVFQRVVETGSLQVRGIERLRQDGTLVRLDVAMSRLDVPGGPLICGVLRDISEVWMQQQLLENREAWFRKIFEESPLGTVVGDLDGNVVRANKEYCRITGLSASELLGRNFAEFTVLEDIAVEREQFAALQAGEIQHFTLQKKYLRQDGTVVPANLLVTMLDGDPQLVLGLVQDETERQLLLQRMQKAVEVKEVLLREMQHRIKNNLSAVCNLLALDEENIPDRRSRRVMQQAQARIRTMQEIYDQLHRAAAVDIFDLGRFIHRSASSLLELYLTREDRIALIVEEADTVSVSYTVALPFGLLVNELLANTVKHAFKESRQGTVRVSLRSRQHEIALTVADDGCGLPEDFDGAQRETMGVVLVRMLAEQLQGTVEYFSPHRSGDVLSGTTVRIVIPKTKEAGFI